MNTDIFNYYRILGVTPIKSDADIRTQYRSLARAAHPDRPGGDPARFDQVTKAYEAIKDRPARAKHKEAMKLLGRECQPCRGRGWQARQKNFSTTQKLTCEECGGCGYVAKEGIV